MVTPAISLPWDALPAAPFLEWLRQLSPLWLCGGQALIGETAWRATETCTCSYMHTRAHILTGAPTRAHTHIHTHLPSSAFRESLHIATPWLPLLCLLFPTYFHS